MLKIKCGCGQENELVESPEGLRYNKERHGNGELCGGKCFNCNKSLEGLPQEAAAAKGSAAAASKSKEELRDEKYEARKQAAKKPAKSKSKNKGKKAQQEPAAGDETQSAAGAVTDTGDEANGGPPAGEGL